MKIGRASKVVQACCRLHNICVQQRAPIKSSARGAKVHRGDRNGGFQDPPETTGHDSVRNQRDGEQRIRVRTSRQPRREQIVRDLENRRAWLTQMLRLHKMRRPRRSKFSYNRTEDESLASRARSSTQA